MAGVGARSIHAGVGPARRARGSAAVWLLPVALLAAAGWLSHRVSLPADAGISTPRPSLLYAISRRPALSFGFRNFLADVAWLEAVQVSANRKMRQADYDHLVMLLDTVSAFDPDFLVPYLLGGIVLGESPKHGPAALAYLAKGERRFPRDWRLPFYAGYIHYFALGNAADGGMDILRAARIPDSPSYFPLLASRMLAEGNQPETALAFLRELLAHEKDPRRIEVLEERVRQVVVERDLQALEKAVAEYRARKGFPPARITDLVEEGLVGRIPVEPHGGHYVLTAEGTVRSDRAPSRRLKVLRAR